jgi:hypothetical protein
MRAAPELLGVPTVGGRSARPGGGGGESNRSQIILPATQKVCKTTKMGSFAHFLAYKLPKTPVSTQKYLTRDNLETFLWSTSI